MANFSSNAAFPRGGVDSRSVFITRTYTHLVAGILGFILVELGLFESGLAEQIARFCRGQRADRCPHHGGSGHETLLAAGERK